MKTFAEFLNDSKEWHAFFIGFFRSCWLIDLNRLNEDLRADIELEYHYHLGGYWFGRVMKFVIVLGLGYFIGKAIGK